jgi:hypothetical protein
MTPIDAGKYYDDGPLVVRVEHVVDDGVVFEPVQAGGTRIDDPDFAKVGRDDFASRFRRL